MATQVIRSYDYYNSLTLLPDYVLSGYEAEQSIAKADYSTNFSANPIGSKIDFYNHLNDPCLAISNPNAVFSIPKALSALDPQWFNGWWDNAMFYSHPLVTDQISATNPSVYQAFSDSVGYLGYATAANDSTDPTYGNDAISPAIASKVPNRILGMINGLNTNIQGNIKSYTPSTVASNKLFLSQVGALKNVSSSLQSSVANSVGALKNKLPFNTNFAGNLITPNSWSHSYNVEGVNTVVNKANSIVSAPSKLLSSAITKAQSIIPKVTLPSINKLVGAYVPNMPATSGVISDIQAAGTVAKTAISNAQSTLATGIGQLNNAVGVVNNTTGQIVGNATSQLPIVNTVSVANINQTVTTGNVTSALVNQSTSQLTSLNGNTATIINPGAINGQNVTSVVNVIGTEGTNPPKV